MNETKNSARTHKPWEGRFFPITQRLFYWIDILGFNPVRFLNTLRGFPPMLLDYWKIRHQNRASGSPYRMRLSIPRPEDRYMTSGSIPRHYFHQDLFVARKIFLANPHKHIDVGSRIDGFVAHVATFRPIEVFDIRPSHESIKNVTFHQVDLMDVPREYLVCCDSLSCLHALEHFGLGRYGDTLNLEGHKLGFQNLKSMLKRNGFLYLSVPIGPERIDFNAHRVFAVKTILELAGQDLALMEFSYIDDAGELHENVQLTDESAKTSLGCYYGCGIFVFRKASGKSAKVKSIAQR
jgi:hypothetical protein